jgi:hypothetical protein
LTGHSAQAIAEPQEQLIDRQVCPPRIENSSGAAQKEIFYLSGTAMMAVDVTGGLSQPGAPTQLFRFPSSVGAPAQLSSIVSADGQRFVQAVAAPRPPAR